MSFAFELHRVRPGDPVTARAFNALVDAVRPLGRMTATPPLSVSRDAAGVRIALAWVPRWEVVELTESLSTGGTASAKIKWYDGNDWVDAGLEPITVVDALGTFEGAASDRAIAFFHQQSGLWVVVQVVC